MVTFFITLMISQISTQLTHLLAQKEKIGSVRASSMLTLIFIGLTYHMTHPLAPTLQAAFLGSSFVGMTDPKRLKAKHLFVSSFIFTLIFHFLLGYLKGFGGVLGLSAFLSSLVTYVMWRGKNRIITNGWLRS